MERFLKLLVLLAFVTSCAVQVPPSGGPKDLTPPVVEKMFPENKSINFNATEFQIRFNKFILLNNPNDQIIISPPLDEKPDFEIKGKVLRVRHIVGLKPNTTYTFNFGNSVADNHENNVIDNLHYVFATGSVLDTNIISGMVLNSFTRKPEKNISIGIYNYDGFNDSVIYKQKPVYFSKTKDNGYFILENIPNVKFSIIGFKDENGNIKYNKNEPLFFKNNFILPNDTVLKNNIHWLFTPNPFSINRIIDTFSNQSGKFCFLVFNPTGFNVKPIKNVPFFTKVINTGAHIDSVFIYSDSLKKDTSVLFNISLPDTSFIVKIIPRKKIKTPSFTLKNITDFEMNDSFNIHFTNPIKFIDTTRILFTEDTIRHKYHYIINPSKNFVQIYYPIKEKTKYGILVKDSAFIDIFNQYSRKIKYELTTRALKDYSSLQINFILDPSPSFYIVQLINSSETMVYREFTIQNACSKTFEYLLPGTYKIKIIKDENKNGVWDNGDLLLKQQPERVYYHPEPIILKAYWDLEQTININSILNK